jgi:hypothetical protein
MKEGLSLTDQSKINIRGLSEEVDPFEDDAPKDFADELDFLELMSLSFKKVLCYNASRQRIKS